MSARSDLAAAIAPLLPTKPKKWVIIPTERNVDEIKVPTLMIRQRKFEPAPNYQGSLITTFTLTVLCPVTDPNSYEDELDDEAATVHRILRENLPNLLWHEATKRVFDSRYFAYDFDVESIAPITPES